MDEEMLTFNEICLWRSVKDAQDTNTLRNVNNCLGWGILEGGRLAVNRRFANLPGDCPTSSLILRGTFSALDKIDAPAALHKLSSVVYRLICIFVLKS
ncbi:hypothetical protein HAX54_000086 [Datura stramonium]|uniref:Uncharacterized protein n=1 Tax=Datura stramonium TaxID=4076 RepID=A0ABS8RIZ7_DATST|nr:hypothetical protein [Datura stramonium]